VAGLILVLLVLPACDDQTPAAAADQASASGRISIAVGDDIRAFGLHQATCEVVVVDDVRLMNVVAPAAKLHTIEGVETRPDLLTASLPAELRSEPVTFGSDTKVLGAIATAPGAEYDGEEYPLLQIIARSVRDGSDTYKCRASRDGDEISLVCNGGKVFPWSAPGPVPGGSFKATVNCKNNNGN
jgi:hypothetical protein